MSIFTTLSGYNTTMVFYSIRKSTKLPAKMPIEMRSRMAGLSSQVCFFCCDLIHFTHSLLQLGGTFGALMCLLCIYFDVYFNQLDDDSGDI